MMNGGGISIKPMRLAPPETPDTRRDMLGILPEKGRRS